MSAFVLYVNVKLKKSLKIGSVKSAPKGDSCKKLFCLSIEGATFSVFESQLTKLKRTKIGEIP